jgi:hypothetical protein
MARDNVLPRLSGYDSPTEFAGRVANKKRGRLSTAQACYLGALLPREIVAQGTMKLSTTFLLIHWSAGATKSMFATALSRESVVQPQHFHS